LIDVETYDCNAGFKFDGDQVHDWRMYGCDSWKTHTYGIDVAHESVSMLRVYGGNISGYSSVQAAVRVKGQRCFFYDQWFECVGAAYAIVIEEGAGETRFIRPYLAAGSVLDLGSGTIIEPVEPTVRQIFDDFIGITGNWETDVSGSGSAGLTKIAGYSGIVRLATGATASSTATLSLASSPFRIYGRIPPAFAFKLRLNSLTNTSALISMYNAGGTRVDFLYDPSTSANWIARCRKAGSETAVDTGVAADTSFHIFKMVASTSVVYFLIDGTKVAEITADIPTGYVLNPRFYIANTAAEDKSLDVDWADVYYQPQY